VATTEHTVDVRAAVDAAIERDDGVAAFEGLARLWRDQPGPAAASFINSRVRSLDPDPRRQSLRMTILRSFTVEPVVPLVRAACALTGIDLAVDMGGFNTYAQEILDRNSSLYSDWAPDVVVLAVQTRDITPELWDDYADRDRTSVETVLERVSGELDALLETFRERSDAPILVHGLELPSTRALGVADAREDIGQRSAVSMLNERLTARCRSLAGAYFVDYDALVREVGRQSWFDERKWAAVRMPIRSEHQALLATEWARYLQPISGLVAKVLVVDLDNTLWGGVLGEEGADGIVLGPDRPGAPYRELQRALLDIRARGVLLAVCSKNDHDDVMDVLRTHPQMLVRPKHLVAVRANWEDKATNLRSIADELGLGIDSLAFIDDSPHECDLVRRQLPGVFVIELDGEPSSFARRVRQSPLFERLALTTDDRVRSDQYARRREAQDLRAEVGSLEEYLRSLGTRVVVRRADAGSISRIAQLTQKTNQFNLTTRRYTEPQIAHMTTSADWRVYSARVADRFGDHGLVGVALVEATDYVWRLDTFLLSCRVIGRSVETALLAVIAAEAEASGARELDGAVIRTARNAPAQDLLKDHGFVCTSDEAGISEWRLDLTPLAVSVPDWIELLVDEPEAE
jgi:FkbH-like protein